MNLAELFNATFPWLLTEQKRKQIERETMIRCVNLIDRGARDYYERMTRNENDQEEIAFRKADAFTRQCGAAPILEELGMTFPECRARSNNQ